MSESVKRDNRILKLGIFILNPILGFVVSLRDIRSKSSYMIFFLFTILFGVCFSVPSGRTEDFTGDGAVYRLRFDRMALQSNDDFQKVYNEYVQFEDGEKDFYVTALSYVISRFTSNYHWVFAVFAFVFGYFMLKSFEFLTKEKAYDNSLYCFMLAVIFIMSNCIFNINGVRFFTAAWIAVYCIFQIFVNRNNKYFILALITPFIHVSFFVFLLIITIAYFSKSYNRFWFVLFIISFFLASFMQDFLKATESIFPSFISRTINLYTDQNIINQIDENRLWYAKIFLFMKKFSLNIVVFTIYRNRHLFSNNPKCYNLFQFLIVWMTFVNISIAIPSLGGRFLLLALPIVSYIWLVALKDIKKFQSLFLFFLLAFSMDFVYQLRSILKVTEIDFYISSPIYLIYKYLF